MNTNELLIANGQQTADLLRHLADNEIDSDYFAVVSECESYGQETEAELSITEFALRAAGYVDALVEALEKAQHRIDELENDEVRQRLANAEHQLYMAELAKNNLRASRKAQFRKRKAAEQRIAELESRTVTVKPMRPGHITVGGEKLGIYMRDEVDEFLAALAAAGIKWEAE